MSAKRYLRWICHDRIPRDKKALSSPDTVLPDPSLKNFPSSSPRITHASPSDAGLDRRQFNPYREVTSRPPGCPAWNGDAAMRFPPAKQILEA
jgi:hypothetical protein